MIGKNVQVFWPVDDSWYTGTVQEYDPSSGEHLLRYEDGDAEWVRIGESASGTTTTTSSRPPNEHLAPVSPSTGEPSPHLGGPPNGTPSLENVSSGGISPDRPYPGDPSMQQHPGMGGPRPNYVTYQGRPGPPLPPGTLYFGSPMQAGMSFGVYPPPPHMYPPPHYGAPGGGGDLRGMDGGGPPGESDMDRDSGKRKTGPKVWTKEEDSTLLSIVQKMNMPMKWSVVAQSLPDRTGKQCRERYVNHLNPRLKTSDWNPVEDSTIFHLYNTIGSHWSSMSKVIPGRTDNGIKNRFHNLRRQLEREDEHRLRQNSEKDFPEQIRLEALRKFPTDLQGKADQLWDIESGIGILSGQSVLGAGAGLNKNYFGPFLEPEPGQSCVRCGFFIPSVQTGEKVCSKTGWCVACTRIPPHLSGNLLRECLSLRREADRGKRKIIEAWLDKIMLESRS
jgi:Myb-like DNA-binding domain